MFGRAIGRLEGRLESLLDLDIERRLTALEAERAEHQEHHRASAAEERHQRQAREWIARGALVALGFVLNAVAKQFGWL